MMSRKRPRSDSPDDDSRPSYSSSSHGSCRRRTSPRNPSPDDENGASAHTSTHPDSRLQEFVWVTQGVTQHMARKVAEPTIQSSTEEEEESPSTNSDTMIWVEWMSNGNFECVAAKDCVPVYPRAAATDYVSDTHPTISNATATITSTIHTNNAIQAPPTKETGCDGVDSLVAHSSTDEDEDAPPLDPNNGTSPSAPTGSSSSSSPSQYTALCDATLQKSQKPQQRGDNPSSSSSSSSISSKNTPPATGHPRRRFHSGDSNSSTNGRTAPKRTATGSIVRPSSKWGLGGFSRFFGVWHGRFPDLWQIVPLSVWNNEDEDDDSAIDDHKNRRRRPRPYFSHYQTWTEIQANYDPESDALYLGNGNTKEEDDDDGKSDSEFDG